MNNFSKKATRIVWLLLGLNVFLCFSQEVKGQIIQYAYDNAGNRTERIIQMNTSPSFAPESLRSATVLTDLIAEKAVKIYPNPTRGLLSVEISNCSPDSQVEFYLADMSGRTILTRKAASGYQSFDLNRQAPGVYLLRISIDGESAVWKIIKE